MRVFGLYIQHAWVLNMHCPLNLIEPGFGSDASPHSEQSWLIWWTQWRRQAWRRLRCFSNTDKPNTLWHVGNPYTTLEAGMKRMDRWSRCLSVNKRITSLLLCNFVVKINKNIWRNWCPALHSKPNFGADYLFMFVVKLCCFTLIKWGPKVFFVATLWLLGALCWLQLLLLCMQFQTKSGGVECKNVQWVLNIRTFLVL